MRGGYQILDFKNIEIPTYSDGDDPVYAVVPGIYETAKTAFEKGKPVLGINLNIPAGSAEGAYWLTTPDFELGYVYYYSNTISTLAIKTGDKVARVL